MEQLTDEQRLSAITRELKELVGSPIDNVQLEIVRLIGVAMKLVMFGQSLLLKQSDRDDARLSRLELTLYGTDNAAEIDAVVLAALKRLAQATDDTPVKTPGNGPAVTKAGSEDGGAV